MSSRRHAPAFTLVELLLAVALLAFIVAVVSQMTQQTSQVWRSSANRIQSFQEARAAFESMTRTLNQATLNTYHEYYDASNRPRAQLTAADRAAFVPATYDRYSDLHFISGQAGTLLAASPKAVQTQTHAVFFQAPLGRSAAYDSLRGALNACGYFLKFSSDEAAVPEPVKKAPQYKARYRYRLMEMTQRTERLGVYQGTATSSQDWFVNQADGASRVVAENVVAIVLLPKLSAHDDVPSGAGAGVSLAPRYNYNTRVPRAAMDDPSWPAADPPFPADQFLAYPSSGGSAVGASRHHQLPPLMKVVMVVLDEASASLVQGNATTPPKALDFSGVGLFRNAAAMDSDLKAVEDILNAQPGNLTQNQQRLTYRIFSTEIIMREAKWSAN
ncbi:MAG: prepilin-type N-terminal cleavage/methylation domain-containing protein [Verrucomicrobium sp.]|nr:prepilin-type N-terminal cleavage/methylation domain-containing protein [Verrucomicrobium sp.]